MLFWYKLNNFHQIDVVNSVKLVLFTSFITRMEPYTSYSNTLVRLWICSG